MASSQTGHTGLCCCCCLGPPKQACVCLLSAGTQRGAEMLQNPPPPSLTTSYLDSIQRAHQRSPLRSQAGVVPARTSSPTVCVRAHCPADTAHNTKLNQLLYSAPEKRGLRIPGWASSWVLGRERKRRGRARRSQARPRLLFIPQLSPASSLNLFFPTTSAQPAIPTLSRLSQEDRLKFQAGLGYTVSSRPG